MTFKNVIYIIVGISFLLSCGDDPSYMHGYRDGDILIPFQKEGSTKWGFINYDGEVVVDPILSQKPSHAVHGISLVADYEDEDDIFYFVRIKDGKLTYPGKHYNLAGEFKDGLAPVRGKNSRVQFINSSFKTVFTVEASEVGYFNEGMAAYKDFEGKWGFLNGTGKTVIKPQFDDFVHGFSGGYAAVANIVEDERETLIIDKSGKVHSRYKMEVYEIKIREGKIGLVTEEGCGYFSPDGKKIVSIHDDWEMITPFFNGYASFMEDYRWGLIDSTGAIVLPSDYECPIYVSEDRAWVCSDEHRSRQWTIKFLDDLTLQSPWLKLRGTPYPFMCGKSLISSKYQSSFIDYSGETVMNDFAKRVSSFNPKYYPGFAWNETFNSTAFEEELILNEIPLSVFQDTTLEQWRRSMEITPEELFGPTDDFEVSYLNNGYQMYSSNTFVTRTWYNHRVNDDFSYLRNIDDYDDYYEEAKSYAATAEPDIDFPFYAYLAAPYGVRTAVMEIEFDAPYADEYYDRYYFGEYDKKMASTKIMTSAERMKFRRLSDEEKYEALTINPKASFKGFSYAITLMEDFEDSKISLAHGITEKVKPYVDGELREVKSADRYTVSGTLKNGLQFSVRTSDEGIYLYVTKVPLSLFEYYWEDGLEQIDMPVPLEDDF